HQIFYEQGLNASVLTASSLFGVGTIVVVTIFVSDGELLRGLVDVVVFGLLGLVMFGITFKITDWLTPGHLGTLLVEDEGFHPAVLVTSVANLAVAAILAVSIIP